jgi:ubiquinone/menaquinone biosynthesis C-methylase UbiE
MGDSHADLVQWAFSHQAAAFEEQPIFTTGSEWVFERLDLRADDLVLDVAAGTGHLARALAPSVRCVVALDATAAMLAAGKAHAERAGLRNVVFQRGDAAALPFADATFDVAVSRFAVHHFEDPAAPLAEMRRCLRPGGRLAIADIVAADDPAAAALQNRLERLRDPSHSRLLPLGELVALVPGSPDVEVRDLDRPLAPWLEQTATSEAPAAEITAALRAELAGGPPTGFRAHESGGELRFVHRLASIIAQQRR